MDKRLEKALSRMGFVVLCRRWFDYCLDHVMSEKDIHKSAVDSSDAMIFDIAILCSNTRDDIAPDYDDLEKMAIVVNQVYEVLADMVTKHFDRIIEVHEAKDNKEVKSIINANKEKFFNTFFVEWVLSGEEEQEKSDE